MIVYEHTEVQCPICRAPMGVGIDEESSGWSVYGICCSDGRPCVDRCVGTVPMAAVEHGDDVLEQARELVRTAR